MEMTMAMLARPNMIHHMDVPNIMRDMAVNVDRSPGLASYEEGARGKLEALIKVKRNSHTLL